MAKYYFRLALLVGSIIGFFWLIGSLLPRGYDFETEIDIVGPPEIIFPKLNTLKQWSTWSKQWNPKEIDSLQISYNDQPAGVGAGQTWSDIRGRGKLWITKSQPNDLIEYEMLYANFPKMTSRWRLNQTGTITKLTWQSEGLLPGGPFYGYFGSFFSIQMKNQYDLSLQQLKELIESQRETEN